MDYIVADTPFAKDETGDLKIPIENGIIISDDIHMFTSKRLEGTIFFKSVGMALFDNVVAEKLYLQALKKNKGQVLEG
jgi:ornithine cyclodeaminase